MVIQAEPDSYLGARVSKKFPGYDELFTGVVDNVVAKDAFPFHVKYDDGDDEWMDLVELESIINPNKGADKKPRAKRAETSLDNPSEATQAKEPKSDKESKQVSKRSAASDAGLKKKKRAMTNTEATESGATGSQEKVEPAVEVAAEKVEPALEVAAEKVEPGVKAAVKSLEPSVEAAVKKVKPVVEAAAKKVEPSVEAAVKKVKPVVEAAAKKVEPGMEVAAKKVEPVVEAAAKKVAETPAKKVATMAVAVVETVSNGGEPAEDMFFSQEALEVSDTLFLRVNTGAIVGSEDRPTLLATDAVCFDKKLLMTRIILPDMDTMMKAASSDSTQTLEDRYKSQARLVFAMAESLLSRANSCKEKLLLVKLYLRDMDAGHDTVVPMYNRWASDGDPEAAKGEVATPVCSLCEMRLPNGALMGMEIVASL